MVKPLLQLDYCHFWVRILMACCSALISLLLGQWLPFLLHQAAVRPLPLNLDREVEVSCVCECVCMCVCVCVCVCLYGFVFVH